MPDRIRDGVKASAVVNPSSGVEFLKVERLIIQKLLGFRIGSDKNLKAAVEKESGDGIGPDAATDGVGGFEKEERNILRMEASGGGEAGKTSAYDDNAGLTLRRGEASGGVNG